MKSVVAIVANIKKYRPPFYLLLADELRAHGVRLTVVYSDPDPAEVLKNDSTDLPPPVGMKVKARHFLGNKASLQMPQLSVLKSADLVIVVQANGYLLNYLLLPLGWLGIKRIAFWGHAYNHQGGMNSLQERFKRLLATKVQWWFTYTIKTAEYLVNLGFPKNRITVVENAVDTTGFAKEVCEVTEEEAQETRHGLGIPPDACVALFCGSLYADKQLDFLIRIGDALRQTYDDFYLVIIGDGPEKEFINKAGLLRAWLKYCGSLFGKERSRYFAASDFFINPGLVGLGILDSFAAGLPFVTSRYTGHSPEIAYLEHNKNGLMLPFEVDQFTEGVSKLISDSNYLQSLKQGALASGARYTVENMAKNVSGGILNCLGITDKEEILP